jgi:SagB-type dehydrogenase family enzyme
VNSTRICPEQAIPENTGCLPDGSKRSMADKEDRMSDKIGPVFIQRTKYPHLERSDQMLGKDAPEREMNRPEGAKPILLPDPETCPLEDMTVGEAIARRRSVRAFSERALSMEELSFLLWATQGVESVLPGGASLRTVPSAGARHALETFILVNRVNPLKPGVYRYLAYDRRIIALPGIESAVASLTGACLNQRMVGASAAAFFWAAVPERMTWRYSQRGYRYLFLDAGHAAQNLYLAAEAIRCGVCAIAAFDDDALNQVLGLDGEKQLALYAAVVGKKR